MALQQDNLMLLDDAGYPRTIDTTNDSIGITTDVIIGGDLTVDGDIVSIGTRDVVVTDNFIDLNNGNVAAIKAGGLTVQVESANEQELNLGAGVTFESQATAPGAFARFKLETWDPDAAGLVANQVIQFSGLSDNGENNGLFTVQSVTAGAGGWVEVKNANTAEVPFCQTDFADGSEDLAASYVGWGLGIGVIAISDGTLPDGAGGTIAKGSFVTAYSASANDQPYNDPGNLSGFKYGDAATVTLQEAYDSGPEIQLSDSIGDMIIKLDMVNPEADFQVRDAVSSKNYMESDAANTKVLLGDGSDVNVEMGHIGSSLTFKDTGVAGTMHTINTAVNADGIEIRGGYSLDLQSLANTDTTSTTVGSAGTGGKARALAAAPYANGTSVGGDLTGQLMDQSGVQSVLTIPIPAGAADIAALVAAINTAMGANTVEASEQGGALALTSDDGGHRVQFILDAESAPGIATSIGFAALPIQSSLGTAALRLNTPGGGSDISVSSAGNVDVMADRGISLEAKNANQKIELKAQNASGEILLTAGNLVQMSAAGATVTANTGTLDLNATAAGVDIDAGTKVLIDGATGVEVGQGTASATLISGTSVAIDGNLDSSFSVVGVDKSISMDVTGGGNLQKASVTSAGTSAAAVELSATAGGVTLSAAAALGITLDSGSALATVNLKGFFAQDWINQSDGVGMSLVYDGAAGVNSVVGQVFAFYNNAGTAQAKTVAAGDAEAANLSGCYLEAVAPAAVAKCHTAHGFVTALNFDANPNVGDAGSPVYLHTVAGQVSLTAPTGTAEHVVRVGFYTGNGTNCIWMPQYIAKRP